MKRTRLFIICFGLWVPMMANADRPFPMVDLPSAIEECGACHLAFQPQMLPEKSWARLFDELENHFGEDASLEPDVQNDIERYYRSHAADRTRFRGGRKFLRGIDPDNPVIRITETRYFKKEHRDLDEEGWVSRKKDPISNCESCHEDAKRGNYDDD